MGNERIVSQALLTLTLFVTVGAQAQSAVCPNLLILNETSGVITSPFYPSNYPNNVKCSWKITASKGKRVKLVIEDIYTSGPYNYLEIQNGSLSGDGAPYGRMCGRFTGKVIFFSFQETLNVLFTTVGGRTYRGFKATYTQVNFTDITYSCTSGGFLNGSSGFFSSPNFPNKYPQNSICNWNITVPRGYIVKISFLHFELDNGYQTFPCYVIHGALGARVAITNVASDDGYQPLMLCGQRLPLPVYSAGNSIQVTFTSLTNQYSGFNASYTAVTYQSVCPKHVTMKEASGVITSPYYPRYYGHNHACSWEITASKGKHIALIIEDMYMFLCYLEIQTGSLSSDGASKRIHGILMHMVTFVSIKETLKVQFVSGVLSNYRYRGFKAAYTQVSYPLSGCSKYTFLKEANRAITSYNRSIHFLCDANLTGWYRFGEEAGSQMADSCVNTYHCGAEWAGWLNGSHPAVADGAVQRQVCYSHFGNCCQHSNYISVLNCGRFYVYKLNRPPQCCPRYCGNGLPHAPECYNYTFLNEWTRATTYRSGGNQCDGRLSGWYRFSGRAGNQMAESCVATHMCGTYSPGWLNGSHPTVDDGAVQRRVCFKCYCTFVTYISVRNCGGFYVYKLNPVTWCPLRYCGNGFVPPTPATPANVQGHNTSSTSILLQWRAATAVGQIAAILSYTVTYKALPGGSLQIKVVSPPATQVTLTGLKEYTKYSIKLFASNVHGNGSISAPIVVTTDEDKPYTCPTDVQGHNTSSTSLLVRWGNVPEADQNGVILSYTVTYKALPDGSTQTKVVSAPTTQVNLTGLNKYTNYSMTVFASTVKGGGIGSVSIVVITDEDKPEAPPTYVQGYNTSSTSILIQWGNVPAVDQNGIILSYTLTYKALPDGSTQTKVVSAPTTQVTLTGLNEYTNYSITVFASTVKGGGNKSTPIIIITDEDKPNAPPTDVKGHNTSSTSILVEWGNVSPADQDGIILSYTVTYKALPDGSQQTKIVSAPTTHAILTGLNEFTKYSITVLASTVKGGGRDSAPIIVITDEDKPSASPPNLKSLDKTSTSILVTWNEVPAPDRNGIIMSYTVRYRAIGGGNVNTPINTKTVDSSIQWVNLDGLTQDTFYRICVLASTIKGDGNYGDALFVRTNRQDKPSAAPDNVSGHKSSSTSIRVTWGEVPADKQHGQILHYTVIYQNLKGSTQKTKQVSYPTREVELANLAKDTDYSIRVSAATANGNGPASVPITVRTDEDNPPRPSPPLKENIGETEVAVEFLNKKALSNGNPVRYFQMIVIPLTKGKDLGNLVDAKYKTIKRKYEDQVEDEPYITAEFSKDESRTTFTVGDGKYYSRSGATEASRKRREASTVTKYLNGKLESDTQYAVFQRSFDEDGGYENEGFIEFTTKAKSSTTIIVSVVVVVVVLLSILGVGFIVWRRNRQNEPKMTSRNKRIETQESMEMSANNNPSTEPTSTDHRPTAEGQDTYEEVNGERSGQGPYYNDVNLTEEGLYEDIQEATHYRSLNVGRQNEYEGLSNLQRRAEVSA